MYTEQDLVRIAKRENNNKRNYLVVNRLQGKHIPVKPQEALLMFRTLADTLKGKYKGEKLLLIGFAETATAIGAAVAAELEADYMQTTREFVPDSEYLYFSEEHSHATEQKLVKNDLDDTVKTIDRIVFIEDEVTTGKTILNGIHVLKKQYSKKIQFSVASILNGMDKTALDTYKNYNIELFWLVKTNHAAYTEIAESYKENGTYVCCADCIMQDQTRNSSAAPDITYIKIKDWMDTRRIVHSAEYTAFCASLYQKIADHKDVYNAQKLLVLGTEECMYPALYMAARLEAQKKEVRFHATTRSPIAVSAASDYPLHTRFELKSLYDSERTTYIYDLQKYDTVVIVTDAKGGMTEGMNTLCYALQLCGNRHIVCVC